MFLGSSLTFLWGLPIWNIRRLSPCFAVWLTDGRCTICTALKAPWKTGTDVLLLPFILFSCLWPWYFVWTPTVTQTLCQPLCVCRKAWVFPFCNFIQPDRVWSCVACISSLVCVCMSGNIEACGSKICHCAVSADFYLYENSNIGLFIALSKTSEADTAKTDPVIFTTAFSCGSW